MIKKAINVLEDIIISKLHDPIKRMTILEAKKITKKLSIPRNYSSLDDEAIFQCRFQLLKLYEKVSKGKTIDHR